MDRFSKLFVIRRNRYRTVKKKKGETVDPAFSSLLQKRIDSCDWNSFRLFLYPVFFLFFWILEFEFKLHDGGEIKTENISEEIKKFINLYFVELFSIIVIGFCSNGIRLWVWNEQENDGLSIFVSSKVRGCIGIRRFPCKNKFHRCLRHDRGIVLFVGCRGE